ncbi:MAG TPA: 2OG-Fe dioxygenase family protein [Sphingobium sp.]
MHLLASDLRGILGWSETNWTSFARSWERLGPDSYMADGGRYRRRSHAAFEARGRDLVRKRHQPHFQSRDYNPLNGDVQRWFDPIDEQTAENPIFRAIFSSFTPLFEALDGRSSGASWHSEVHQFRIESSSSELGRPTPEGLHRDGVDWVLVMLVARQNVEEGTTEIGDPDGRPLGRFTLRDPGEAVLLDDRRIRHGVTPIHAVLNTVPAYRDALVVTWQAQEHP